MLNYGVRTLHHTKPLSAKAVSRRSCDDFLDNLGGFYNINSYYVTLRDSGLSIFNMKKTQHGTKPKKVSQIAIAGMSQVSRQVYRIIYNMSGLV